MPMPKKCDSIDVMIDTHVWMRRQKARACRRWLKQGLEITEIGPPPEAMVASD